MAALTYDFEFRTIAGKASLIAFATVTMRVNGAKIAVFPGCPVFRQEDGTVQLRNASEQVILNGTKIWRQKFYLWPTPREGEADNSAGRQHFEEAFQTAWTASTSQTPAVAPTKANLPSGWEEFRDQDGDPYYAGPGGVVTREFPRKKAPAPPPKKTVPAAPPKTMAPPPAPATSTEAAVDPNDMFADMASLIEPTIPE